MEPNYQEMYLTMVRASEQAIRALIAAQQTCEALYIAAGEETQKAEGQSQFLESSML